MVNIVRTQTGVRIERRILKVLKGLAAHLEISLSELLEGIALHAFEGLVPFNENTLAVIAKLKDAYDLDLTSADAHTLADVEEES
jgi:hypothetical protein